MPLSHINIRMIILMVVLSSSYGCKNKSKNKDRLQTIYEHGFEGALKNINEIPVIDSSAITLDLTGIECEYTTVTPIHFMKICPKNETLVGVIDKIVRYNDKFYILDKTTNSLLILDNDGNMIFNIHNLGKASGEYNTISDFCIDDKNQQVVIYDAKSKKFIHHNLNGEFLKEYKTLIWAKEFAMLNSGDCCMLTLGNNHSGYQLLFADSIHRVNHKAIPVNIKYSLNLFSGGKSLIQNYNEETLISSPFSNKIYSVHTDGVLIKYVLELGKRGFDYLPDKHKDMNGFVEALSNNRNNSMFSLGGFMETDQQLLISLSFNKKGYVVVYEKNKKSLKIQSLALLESLHLAFPKFHIDNYLVSVIDPEWMIQNKDLMIKKYGLENFYADFRVDSNPILVFYKIP